MTKSFAIICLLLLSVKNQAQSSAELSVTRQGQIDSLITFIQNNQIAELAQRVRYPLKRPNPVPDIQNAAEFIRYYPTLMDSNFRSKLINQTYTQENTIERYVTIGLLNGEIWLDEEGWIISFNHHSSQELALQMKLREAIKARIHSSVSTWKENILVCQNKKFLIRIDRLENNELRYCSWSETKTISDPPDLILFQGKEEFQGTMGGVNYVFSNGEWTYSLDQVQMAESIENLGLFLRLYRNDELVLNSKMEEIK
ncbi:hypothetical protein [Croceimicrobium sp.]|uniref:hypothetical protein n=1 Tax=Croceimicrobium sp. TaxID=2828340 RepID=UPI003BAA8320